MTWTKANSLSEALDRSSARIPLFEDSQTGEVFYLEVGKVYWLQVPGKRDGALCEITKINHLSDWPIEVIEYNVGGNHVRKFSPSSITLARLVQDFASASRSVVREHRRRAVEGELQHTA